MSQRYPRQIQSRQDQIAQESRPAPREEQARNDALRLEQVNLNPELFRGGTVVVSPSAANINQAAVNTGGWFVDIRLTNLADSFAPLTANTRSVFFASLNSVGIAAAAQSLVLAETNRLRWGFAPVSGWALAAGSPSIVGTATLNAAMFTNRSLNFGLAPAFTINS
jgi:hypothetical protein